MSWYWTNMHSCSLTSIVYCSNMRSWRKMSSLILRSWNSSSIWPWASSSCWSTPWMCAMELQWGVLLVDMAASLWKERQTETFYHAGPNTRPSSFKRTHYDIMMFWKEKALSMRRSRYVRCAFFLVKGVFIYRWKICWIYYYLFIQLFSLNCFKLSLTRRIFTQIWSFVILTWTF